MSAMVMLSPHKNFVSWFLIYASNLGIMISKISSSKPSRSETGSFGWILLVECFQATLCDLTYLWLAGAKIFWHQCIYTWISGSPLTISLILLLFWPISEIFVMKSEIIIFLPLKTGIPEFIDDWVCSAGCFSASILWFGKVILWYICSSLISPSWVSTFSIFTWTPQYSRSAIILRVCGEK